MTPRARAYLLATGLYCLGMSFGCLFLTERFNSVSFGVLERAMPFGLDGWGVVHLALAIVALFASWSGRERPAMVTLIAGAAIVGAWAYGFWNAQLTQPHPGAPTAVCAYSFITIIHLINARQPLRSPFDPILRSLDRDD